MARKKLPVVILKVLPGEPTDGTGRVCIHLFVRDEAGSFTQRHVLHSVLDTEGKPIKGRLEARPARGRLACSRTLIPTSIVKGNTITKTLHSEEPRATTCPRCMNTPEYKSAMELLS